jgi:TrmH family RNA methyltransferase
MMFIESQDNKRYKSIKSLAMKKYRDREGAYLVEGEKVIREAIAAGLLETLLFREGYEDAGGLADMSGGNVETLVIRAALFDRLKNTETAQGVAGVIKKREISREAFMKSVEDEEAKLIILDSLQDPGNVGTILRTANGAGYAGAVLTKGTADIYSPKVLRSASGAVMRMPVISGLDAHEIVDMLRRNGFTIYGTGPRAELSYSEVSYTGRTALVIGNEGRGMSEEFTDACDVNISIPMKRETESLNAAVAAGIIIYKTIEA